jgi:aspartyl/glutamyl-tRNA(Asn/Gln) amidotransferase C subunit
MVSYDDIKLLGRLSRLDLTKEEVKKYASQFEEITNYLNKLDSIAVDEIDLRRSEKCYSALRKDFAKSSGLDLLLHVKNKKDYFIKGPRIT